MAKHRGTQVDKKQKKKNSSHRDSDIHRQLKKDTEPREPLFSLSNTNAGPQGFFLEPIVQRFQDDAMLKALDAMKQERELRQKHGLGTEKTAKGLKTT